MSLEQFEDGQSFQPKTLGGDESKELLAYLKATEEYPKGEPEPENVEQEDIFST